jgi:VWFA-related protein
LYCQEVLTALFAAVLLAQEAPRAGETITVERILIDARVTDSHGEPLLGLEAADFGVRIDGKPAAIESAEWIQDTGAGPNEEPPAEESSAETLATPPPAGRLLIFFFQTDFARVRSRVEGQMSILSYTDDFIENLDPDDRVAVFSFDSHLKFRLDFTGDKEALRRTIREALRTDEPPRPPVVPMPSLARRLDPAEMKAASSSEKALLLIGNALRPIPGPKSMVLFGWGLGRYEGGRVFMTRDYAIARRALESSRVSVFAIDFSQSDSHSLEAGLETAAADTGGFYSKTFRFPRIAMERLERTLEGHYELEVRKPATNVKGVHTIEVTVVRPRDAVVLARSSYTDKE